MRIILDILRPDAGLATWDGRPTHELPRRTWGYLPEERGLYSRMEVLEQLLFFARLYGIPADRAERDARAWMTRFRVTEYAERKAEELSKGNQQKVQFIAALLHDPDVLLLDEPFTGLDPVNVAILKEALLELRDRGKTLVFSTHQMEAVEEMCEDVAIIDRGRVVVAGPIGAVRQSTGRRVIRLAIDGGDLEWLDALRGVRSRHSGRDYVELAVDRDVDPESILHQALARGCRVLHFEIADPSLASVFIEKVGRPADEGESHLAPADEASGTADADAA
jgi:ABC-2 type transport system ATP-binding protein